ncbi:MAG: flagellar protein FlaG [Lachnospiraceae bacterium]|nr:flagellar protein FlaG [Lachnospiraceae bacterium]
MQMESLVGGVAGNYEAKPVVKENHSAESSTMDPVERLAEQMEITPISKKVTNTTEEKEENQVLPGQEKEPAKSSIDAAMSLLNSQIEKTHCAYSYDEEAKRISIKVYDDETDELIREVPPEKSLEALKKIWEIAGIIIDEKR